MRWIQKNSEPLELKEWRSRFSSDINFDYKLMRQDHKVTNAVIETLLKEQGWICAYTGKRIESDSCHIEHVKAQAHCERGEDVQYTNLVACYPAPNTGECSYGAHQKKDWPSPLERYSFVSPLDQNCETRFTFSLIGNINAQISNDEAAKQTIKRLELHHKDLVALRKNAIQQMLGQTNNLPMDKARQRLHNLERQTSGRLEPFCFVLVQALKKHISRLEGIKSAKRKVK
jgi:uncharacterized protein (TIGR02646 family)